ncbi:hypothetical protein [Klebsiella pneumoniae]|uniref:hypothetical protein n=1 Tax=Klebsiella pneumoniae TaxID=573 RepID=UPI00226D9ED2|nr:hypothetical protein [Klebsiella pneumoniae]MCY0159057.1 hypothetical protein [Klebsiella pneumoniae]HBX8072220.1 hypothetical protein [Klebsiella pneumoniae]
MTVSTEVDHNDYTGNGVTTSFPYTFRIFKKSDLTVQLADLNENITVLTLDTDYTVTGAGTYSGGNVVLMSPLASGWQISISRDLPVTQETDLRNQGKFFAEVHEDAFDKLTMLIQQCFSFLRLALRKPSFIANYYDALNNRIRNLRDPSQAQDASTKSYVDVSLQQEKNERETAQKKFLRVPEGFVEEIYPLDARKDSIFGWDSSGRPVPIFAMTETADLALKLASNTRGLGASLIGLSPAGKVQDAINYITPQMYGAVPGSISTDNTAAVQAAITAASGKILDLRGGPWRVTSTLDFTNLRGIITDYTGRILVNPVGFSALHSRKFAVTFGNPDTPFGSNRCTHFTGIGYLLVQSDSRDAELSGVYIKGALMTFGSIRATGFNGHGIRADALWDTALASTSVERCGNLSLHAYDLNPYGDTTNCLFIGRIQVEQSYHKQMNINIIRSVIGSIHSERLKILTLDDGTTGLPSGLTYQNTNINITNTTIGQMILDAEEDTAAGTVSVTPSVRLNLYESEVSSFYLATSIVSSTFGQNGVINSSSFYKYYNPSYSVSMIGCRVTRTAGDGLAVVGGPGFMAVNCAFDTFTPDYNSSGITLQKCTVNNDYNSTNTGVSGVVFDQTIFKGNVSGTGPTEVSKPTEFRSCNILGTFSGAFQHRVLIKGGYINAVSLASRAYAEFESVKGGSFTYTGDRAFVTRGCSFTTVTLWGPPTFGAYKVGQRTQRIGAMPSGTGVEYVNTTDAGANFVAISTIP